MRVLSFLILPLTTLVGCAIVPELPIKPGSAEATLFPTMFVGTCVTLPARELDKFDESSRDITYRTFAKHVGRAEIQELNKSFGVPISRDWHVKFAKGKWRGKPAVCLFHSSIHHIYTIK